jgi:cold shock CspA family protein
MSSENDTGSQRVWYTGRVKWFNNKAGFGFVNCLSDDRDGEDVFVHHSGIKVDSEQYKYLVQGEYVAFYVKNTDSEDHPFQAHDVTGVLGGKLMCETRNEIRQATQEYNATKGKDNRPRKTGRRPRRGGGGPRESTNDNDTWVLENQGKHPSKNY